MPSSPTARRSALLTARPPVNMRNPDKQNKVDFRWFIVRTLPHQEKKVAAMLELYMKDAENILEVYCPTHTTVSVSRNGRDEPVPLFAGFVFVLSTQQALTEFMAGHYQEGTVLYDHRKEHEPKAALMTVPEEQMRAFMDFNENYADMLVILERPYSDYAFNSKTGEPNEIVRVIDGPLAGREGYIVRFRKDRRLVFQMCGFGKDSFFTVSVPDAWSLHVVRLHNAEGDRQSAATEKSRAADLLTGMLQGCGYGTRTLPMLYGIIDRLAVKPSLVSLARELSGQGHEALSRRLSRMSGDDAALVMNLVRYEHDNPGYVRSNWPRLVIRPFLTPTSGVDMDEGTCEAGLQHEDFTEIIRRVDITEDVFYPSKRESLKITTTYYAHIGILPSHSGQETDARFVLFADWDAFLGQYFLTAGKANERLVSGTAQPSGDKEKLISSFRNYAPSLYKVLTDAGSAVKAVQGFAVGKEKLNVMAITATDVESGKYELIRTCTAICREINATVHLAVWRRYLRTVWLHE